MKVLKYMKSNICTIGMIVGILVGSLFFMQLRTVVTLANIISMRSMEFDHTDFILCTWS